MKRRTTFNEMLAQVARQDAESLMTRARLANRLAKSLQGRARTRAYSVKHAALAALTESFPGSTRVTIDPVLPDFVLVRFDAEPTSKAASRPTLSLHAPAGEFIARRNHR